MEKKRIDLYTEEERQKLLRHWWNYCSKMVTTPEENKQFLELVKKDSRKAMDVALVSYAGGPGGQLLILAARDNILDSYLRMISEIASSINKSDRKMAEASFIDMMVDSYNKLERIITKILETLPCSSINKIFRQQIAQLYSDSLLTDDEFSKEGPIVDFVVGEGAIGFSLFSADRLNKNRESISLLFDLSLETDQPVDVFKSGCDQNGNYWTNNDMEVDRILQLGLATGIVKFTKPRSEWRSEKPSIVRCKVNDQAKQFVKKPGEYTQTLANLKKQFS